MLTSCLTVLTQISSFAAGSVTLAWDASTDVSVTGYRVYYGPASGTYTNSANVGNTTGTTFNNLVDGATYYFTAVSFDATGTESIFSNEISYSVPAATNGVPTLDAISGVTINEDATPQTVSLSGIDDGDASVTQTLSVTATSSNPGLIPNPTVTYTSPNATGSLTFSPVANANGSATITVTVNDGQSANNTVVRTFTVTVNPVNDVPTLNTINNLTINEDASAQTVSLSGIGSGVANESQALAVTAISSNPSLIPHPTVTYTSPNAAGSLSFTPVANESGSAIITVTVNDGQAANNTIVRTFTVTVNAVNDVPTLNTLGNLTLNENAGLQTVSLAGINTGAANESQTLTVTATSSSPALVPNPTVIYTSPNATGSLSFTPVAGASGSATVTVTVNDGQAANNTVVRTFTVTVNGVNDAPTLNVISDVTINEDASAQSVSLSGITSGSAGEAQTLTVAATSSNPSLIPNPSVAYTSPNATGSLSFTPAANANGTAIISVTVNDGGASNNIVTRTFTVTVNAVNDAPTLNTIANVNLFENASQQTVSLSGIGIGAANESDTLVVTATSSNPGLIPNPSVTYTSPNATGGLNFTPVVDANGSATITVTVNDGQAANNTVVRTFTVTVTPVNNPPTLNSIADVTVAEDAGAQTVSLSGIGSGSVNESQTLTVTATSSNPGLIPNPSVTYASPSVAGSLNFTSAANANGTATITVTVNDGQSTNNTVVRTFTVTVTPVNDAPAFNTIANVTVPGNGGAQSVSLAGISSGATNEAQTLSITATSSNPSLVPNPSVTYTSPGATGSLSFTPAANVDGSAVITVTINDGQAANNTFSRTFTVTVASANTPPTLAAPGNVTIAEDAATQTVNLSGITTGSANETQTLTVTATSSNPGLIPNPTVSYTSPSATGSLNFTPAADGNGSAIITVTVNDGHAISNTVSRTFTVTVTPANDTPTLSTIANVTIDEDAGAQSVALSGISTGATNESQTLAITATSSNPGLIPNPSVTYTSPGATGSLNFTPVANANGTATITVTVNDGQAANNTVVRTFTVTVNAVNDAPTVNTIATVSIPENAGQQTVSLAGISTGAANETQTLAVTATSSNPGLIPNPTVNYTSPNATGSLVFTPAANTSGSATITVTVNDGQAANNTIVRTFTVSVNLANVPPTLAAIGNVSIGEDSAAQTVNLSGISSGSANENQTLSVTATSSNPGLIPNPSVTYTSPNATGSLSFTPAANGSGSATITVTVDDGHAVSNTVSRTFTVTVTPVNDTPTLNTIANVTIDEDASAQTVSLSGISTGTTNEAQTLTVTATSSNPGLIPNPSVTYSSPGATGSLNFTPVANANGSATITVTVNDGQAANNTVVRTFTVTVNAVNDAPTVNTVANRTIAENAALQTVSLAGIGTGAANETQTLSVTATSSDTSLIPNPTVTYASPGAAGSLTFTPVANENGTATITVTVNDGQAANNTVVRTFTVTVTEVNTAPTITAIPNQTIISDTNSGLLNFTIGDVESPATSLTLTASSTAPTIVPLTNIVFGGSGSNRTVRVTPVTGSAGISDLTLTVSDGAASATTTFRVTAILPPPQVGQLSVTKSGQGTVSPDLSATTLIVGQSYTVTAIPASGYVFAGWTGSLQSSSPTVTFTMTSTFALQANFVASPFTAAAATYNGLFYENSEVQLNSAGAFNLFMDGNGNYSAWVQIGYSRHQLSGAFDLNLRATNVITRWSGNPLTIELQVGQGATAGQISGRVTDGVWNSPLSGGRVVASSPYAGEYTVVIPGTANNASLPAGDGYATFHVAADGLGTMSGALADGTPFMYSAYVTENGDWPLHVSMYVGKGVLISWLTFTNLTTSDVSGDLVWIKEAGASATSYPAGFTAGTKAVGSAYAPADDMGKALNLSGAVVTFTGGDLAASFNNVVSVNAGSQVVNLSPNEMTFVISKQNGTFSGKVREPSGNAMRSISGVVFQKRDTAHGFMNGDTRSSRVTLAAP